MADHTVSHPTMHIRSTKASTCNYTWHLHAMSSQHLYKGCAAIIWQGLSRAGCCLASTKDKGHHR